MVALFPEICSGQRYVIQDKNRLARHYRIASKMGGPLVKGKITYDKTAYNKPKYQAFLGVWHRSRRGLFTGKQKMLYYALQRTSTACTGSSRSRSSITTIKLTPSPASPAAGHTTPRWSHSDGDSPLLPLSPVRPCASFCPVSHGERRFRSPAGCSGYAGVTADAAPSRRPAAARPFSRPPLYSTGHRTAPLPECR